LPKLRGYRFNSYALKPVSVSLTKIAKVFPKGGEVNPKTLLELKVIKNKKGILPQVKLLNSKEAFTVKISVSGCTVSKTAQEQILKAGGEVKVIEPKK
jgi:ribosomal protein L15